MRADSLAIPARIIRAILRVFGRGARQAIDPASKRLPLPDLLNASDPIFRGLFPYGARVYDANGTSYAWVVSTCPATGEIDMLPVDRDGVPRLTIDPRTGRPHVIRHRAPAPLLLIPLPCLN